jgi:hypothetical protein
MGEFDVVYEINESCGSDFEALLSTRVQSATLLKSKSTGLQVFIGKVDGPLVHGFFTLATESH